MGSPPCPMCSATLDAPSSMQTSLQEKVREVDRLTLSEHDPTHQGHAIPYLYAVVEPGKPAWKMIVDHFGRDILLEDGRIDRPKLGQIIFQDEAKRKVLNGCTHPYIQRAMLWQVVKHFLRGKSFFLFI